MHSNQSRVQTYSIQPCYCTTRYAGFMLIRFMFHLTQVQGVWPASRHNSFFTVHLSQVNCWQNVTVLEAELAFIWGGGGVRVAILLDLSHLDSSGHLCLQKLLFNVALCTDNNLILTQRNGPLNLKHLCLIFFEDVVLVTALY